MERVQKYISNAGRASRREAEKYIKSGQVLINGKVAKLGDKVDAEKDEVKVYGKIVKPALENIYILLNKPKGYMVTKSDNRGRRTVFALLPKEIRSKVWNIGRLDFDTEGLLIFTNDGDLTQQLSHPKFEHEKEYEALVRNLPSESQLERLRKGVILRTGPTSPARVKVRENRVYITIHEGKNHQVRNMFLKVGLELLFLKRIRIGKLLLPENLNSGQWKKIKKEEIL